MRKNIARVLAAFDKKAERKEDTLWTDGTLIRSYGKLIAARLPGKRGMWITTDDLSRTSNIHRRGVDLHAKLSGIKVWYSDTCPELS